MGHPLDIYNALTRKKEQFIPLHEPYVGMYVCGPTVYGDTHLGHARPAITFDSLFRYLTHLGYKVRYVRNIMDVGHLEHDADDGEDKIVKKARLEQLEPMEVVQYYSNRYHQAVDALNVPPPSVESYVSGHIIEQIELVKKIPDNGYVYESQGSACFDVEKYNKDHKYGILSGRNIEDMLNTTRALDGQDEKHNAIDLVLWKCAQSEHIMRWSPPWNDGFPDWHCECTVTGKKYLRKYFDIHGGGMDLIFPYHEREIAQAVAFQGDDMVHYWMHSNMTTINGQEMGKSLGNFIALEQFFTGDHPSLQQVYLAIIIRSFTLQAHYRSMVDLSNGVLQAVEKDLSRLMEAYGHLMRLQPSATSTVDMKGLREKCSGAMSDDLNSLTVTSYLFDVIRAISSVKDGKATLSEEDLKELQEVFHLSSFDILDMKDEASASDSNYETFSKAVDLLLPIRQQAKADKDWATSDKIRNELAATGLEIKDTKDGAEWKLSKRSTKRIVRGYDNP